MCAAFAKPLFCLVVNRRLTTAKDACSVVDRPELLWHCSGPCIASEQRGGSTVAPMALGV